MKYLWHREVLKKKFKETKYQFLFLGVFFLMTMIWNYFIGQPLEWRWIEIVSQPTIPYRLLYSAAVYVTIGSVLYKVGFYKALCDFVYGILGSYDLYVRIKKVIWLSLLALMYFIIIPFAFFLINMLSSLAYNTLALMLFISPGVFFGLIILTIVLLGKYKK